MTTLRLLFAGLLAGLGLVVLTPATSHACSCAMADTADFLEWSDVAFTGTLTALEPPPERAIMSSTAPNTFTFEVDRVLDGDVPATAEVRSAMSGASCGLEGLEVGRAYVVFASTDGRRLQANLCGGTRPERAPFVAQLEELTGPGRAPEPDPEPDPEAGPDLAAIVASILAIIGL